MSDELKPCPFCGSEDSGTFKSSNLYYVACRCCDAEGPSFFYGVSENCDKYEARSKACKAWNERIKKA